VLKATQLKVIAKDDMSVAQLVNESAKYISGPALDFVSSQLQYCSPQIYKLLAKVFLLPPVKTLH